MQIPPVGHWLGIYSQLQQSHVGVAVKCPVLALLRDIVLEHGGGLRVVPVESIQDGIDMGRSSLTLVKGDHLGGGLERCCQSASLCWTSVWWDF